MSAVAEYTRKDFSSDQEVRWCPGCGDYSILAQVQRVMPEICMDLGLKKENIVFISGIGCSSRFPYYMNNYGFHTIHGRAPTIASGLKLTRPDLQVWVITGDGDGLSIGGNHLIHCLRRNIDVKILLFNNRIYGLTKGQYSPTSEIGKKTKSSPWGTVERPLNPLSLAIASEATFIARAIATEGAQMREVLMRAARHKGSAFIEVFQNCNVFNDGAFGEITSKQAREEMLIPLVDGEPIRFGTDARRGVVLDPQRGARIADVADVGEDALLVHDESRDDPSVAFMLSRLARGPHEPTPIGVFRDVQRPEYGDGVNQQLAEAQANRGPGDLSALLRSGATWQVE